MITDVEHRVVGSGIAVEREGASVNQPYSTGNQLLLQSSNSTRSLYGASTVQLWLPIDEREQGGSTGPTISTMSTWAVESEVVVATSENVLAQ